MNPLKDPVFKGCTRPAMLWGVPLVPFLMIGGGMLIPAVWALLASPPVGVAVLFLMIPVFVAMRVITRHDDQRLAQYALRLRMRLRQRNRRFWGAHAYVPVCLKRRA
ncbi:type IV secretory pathway, VirB3 family protein [Burkholderia lata]|uniref:Type IV secretory pathway, VirB3 family protein n=1 Tax=Burkholderia lata (strain ATCC 17760 / DSM 23089 / LMG 22485 / NCIMB 9086 / R18194 / 383) TaxID=482957 RepID=A0A6P2KXU3_BURL3|nr:VirB3 family type IV secretion system protein [Burkholderia lata]VWB63172.1 type IV secretory pathway, VirB3 family protein [Burkholderia lata]